MLLQFDYPHSHAHSEIVGGKWIWAHLDQAIIKKSIFNSLTLGVFGKADKVPDPLAEFFVV